MVTDNVIIGLGSNLGDSAAILLEAWHRIGAHDTVELVDLSPPYTSSPVDMTSQHWFTNAVGAVRVQGLPLSFLDLLLVVEKQLGRLRDPGANGYQDRTIDLDLIYFGGQVIDVPRLQVPHPHRLERLFVLAPLAGIAPDFVDPLTGRAIAALHADLLGKIDAGTRDEQQITRAQWPRDER